MRMTVLICAVVLIAAGASRGAACAEIKVLSAGAFKQVLLALLPEFEQQTGHKVTVDNDTVGALTKRIEAGGLFALPLLAPPAPHSPSPHGQNAPRSPVQVPRCA